MKSDKSRITGIAVYFTAILLCAGCLGGGSYSPTSTSSTQSTSISATPTPTPTPTPVATASNVMTVTVNGSLCGSPDTQYANEPCASVTICATGTSNCQTIDNILVDTGSFGLRIFASLVNINTSPVTVGGGNLAECIQYGDGSSQWGQVVTVDVVLGNEPATHMPIQLVDSTYATPPPTCTSAQSIPDTDPQEAHFNGILGVGLFAKDCGDFCTAFPGNGMYYSCSGSTCTPTTVPLTSQVPNPVAMLPTDNNGVILQLPSVASSGAASVTGTLILGIDTQANNKPSGVTTYAADGEATISTLFNTYSDTAIPGFIDSGSSLIFMPPAGDETPDCSATYGSDWVGWFCPSSTLSLSAENLAAAGTVASGTVSFEVSNAYTQLNSGNAVFSNIAGLSDTGPNAYFDWGLPFFFGRNVYVGIQGTSSSLGSGPYWAY